MTRSRKSQVTPGAPPAAPLWQSRAAVLVLCVISTIVGALLYTGAGAGLVLLTLCTDGLLLLAWLAAGAGTGAIVLLLVQPRADGARAETQGHVGARSNLLLTAVTAIALGLGAQGLCVLGLGLLGMLNHLSALVLIVAGIVLGCGVLLLEDRRRRTDASTPSIGASLRAWWKTPARWGWAWIVVVPFASSALVGTMVPPGLLWTPEEPHGYDVVEYHLQVPREWYEAGRITPLQHNVFSYFPMGVEMHYLLAMHLDRGPREGMYLAQLMHFAMIVLTVLAVCGVASELVLGSPAPVIAGIATATVPWLTQLGAIAYNEGGFLLYGTLAIGWALLALLHRSHPRWRFSQFILAGEMAGFACGTKLTAVPEILIGVAVVTATVLLWARLRGSSNGASRDVIRGPAVFFIAGLLVFSPWLVRNAIWAANPVFPEAMPLLGRGHFSSEQVTRWERAHAPPPALRPPIARLKEGRRQIVLSWQFGYVLLPLSVVALAVGQRTSRGRSALPALFLGGMLALLALFWLVFTHLQGRFFLLAVPVAALLLTQVPSRVWNACVLAIVVLAAIPGFFQIHARLSARIHEGGADGLVNALGNTDLSWLTGDLLSGLPPDAPLALFGDAKAFWYPLPMSRLRYRTVFDADTSNGRSMEQAWGVAPSQRKPGEWVLVDPAELERFQATYAALPPLPPSLMQQRKAARPVPFLVPPGGTGKTR